MALATTALSPGRLPLLLIVCTTTIFSSARANGAEEIWDETLDMHVASRAAHIDAPNTFCRDPMRDDTQSTQLRLFVHQPLPPLSTLGSVYMSEVVPALDSAVLSISLGPPKNNVPVEVFIYHAIEFANESTLNYHLYYKQEFSTLYHAHKTVNSRKFAHMPGSNVYWIMSWMVPSSLQDSTAFNCAFFVFDSKLAAQRTVVNSVETQTNVLNILTLLQRRYWNPTLEQIDDLQVSRHLWAYLQTYEFNSVTDAYKNLYFDAAIGKNSTCINAYFHHMLNKEFLGHLHDDRILSTHGYSTVYGWLYTRSAFTNIPETERLNEGQHYAADGGRPPLEILQGRDPDSDSSPNHEPNKEFLGHLHDDRILSTHGFSNIYGRLYTQGAFDDIPKLLKSPYNPAPQTKVVYWDDAIPTPAIPFVRPTLMFNQTVLTGSYRTLTIDTTLEWVAVSIHSGAAVRMRSPVIGVSEFPRRKLSECHLESSINVNIRPTNTDWVYYTSTTALRWSRRDHFFNIFNYKDPQSDWRKIRNIQNSSSKFGKLYNHVRVPVYETLDCSTDETIFPSPQPSSIVQPPLPSEAKRPGSLGEMLRTVPTGRRLLSVRRKRGAGMAIMIAVDIVTTLLGFLVGAGTPSSSPEDAEFNAYISESLDTILLKMEEHKEYLLEILEQSERHFQDLSNQLRVIRFDTSRLLTEVTASAGVRRSSFPQYDGLVSNCSSPSVVEEGYNTRKRRSVGSWVRSGRRLLRVGGRLGRRGGRMISRGGRGVWRYRKLVTRSPRTLRSSTRVLTTGQKIKNKLIVGGKVIGAFAAVGVGGKLIHLAGSSMRKGVPENRSDQTLVDRIRDEIGESLEDTGDLMKIPSDIGKAVRSGADAVKKTVDSISALPSYWIIAILVVAAMLCCPGLSLVVRAVSRTKRALKYMMEVAGDGVQKTWAPLRLEDHAITCGKCRAPLLRAYSGSNFTPDDNAGKHAILYSPKLNTHRMVSIKSVILILRTNLDIIDNNVETFTIPRLYDAKEYMYCTSCDNTAKDGEYREIIGFILNGRVTLYLSPPAEGRSLPTLDDGNK